MDTIYINALTKLKVKCNFHETYFEILPSAHKKGVGCPLCANIKRRLNRLDKISKDKYSGYRPIPSFNNKACQIFDNISKEKNIHIQHAMNGGEFYIKELCCWLDGYDADNNIAYEYDEKHHFYKGELRKKDLIRQKEIEKIIGCEFIRIRD